MNGLNSVNRDRCLENIAAELTLAAYRVALESRTQGTWLDLQLGVWGALAEKLEMWDQEASKLASALSTCPGSILGKTDTAAPHGVRDHYGTTSLVQRIDEALHRAGLADGMLGWADLAPLDQFHVRGLGATQELAEALGIDGSASLLDVGCGLGGPARFLAATCGCHVTGIDLSQPFIEAARTLTERCGLAERATFLQGDALDLPFTDASFDHAWTLHVAMNVADRVGLYRSIHRVLKPGGTLAIYDVALGDGGPPIYPVPWAREQGTSFLLTPGAMRDALAQAGLEELSWIDKTNSAQVWAADMKAKRQKPPAPLGLEVVMGPEFAEMAENLGRNLLEGRVRIIQAIMAKTVDGGGRATA